MNDDRRRFRRYDCSFKVTYATNGIVSLESRTTADDVSKGGLRISVSRAIKRGDSLILHIYPREDTSPIAAMGKVKWTEEAPNNCRYGLIAGIEFTNIALEDVEKLLSSVR